MFLKMLFVFPFTRKFSRGPVESGPMWYALARLAVTTWSSFCWGAGCGGETGQYRTYLSRVIERNALFANSLLFDLAATLAAKLVGLAEAADEPDAELEDDGLDGEVLPITVETREQDGWRLSYKRLFPEFEKPEKAVKRLTRKREGMGFIMGLGAQGHRRRSDAELKEASDRTARTRRQYQASVLAKPAVEPVAAAPAVLGVYQVGGASGSGS
jgi:hypothetical protein